MGAVPGDASDRVVLWAEGSPEAGAHVSLADDIMALIIVPEKGPLTGHARRKCSSPARAQWKSESCSPSEALSL